MFRAGGHLLKRLDEPVAVKQSMHRDTVADATADVQVKERGRVDGGLVHALDGRSYVGHDLRIRYELFYAAANRPKVGIGFHCWRASIWWHHKTDAQKNARQPVSNLDEETRAVSSAEFLKAGF